MRSLRVTGEDVAHSREAGLDLRGRDGADAEAEPAGFVRQTEGLERNDGEAGIVEEQAADLFVRLDAPRPMRSNWTER